MTSLVVLTFPTETGAEQALSTVAELRGRN